jgi:hypothetical protein
MIGLLVNENLKNIFTYTKSKGMKNYFIRKFFFMEFGRGCAIIKLPGK